MHARRLVLFTIILIVLAGCSGSESGKEKPSYTPVPDQDLFAQIDQLPGLASSDITFNDSFPEYGYVGRVVIDPQADAQKTLDTLYAILRQGRPDAGIGISGSQGDGGVEFELLPGSGVGTPDQLEERYGPQPGDGAPPAD